jgi:hypothetical protein
MVLLDYDVILEIIKYSNIETKIKINKIFHLKPGKLKIQFEFVPKTVKEDYTKSRWELIRDLSCIVSDSFRMSPLRNLFVVR